jgi:hypothetical protein
MTGSRIPLVIAILLGALLGSAGVAYASFTGSDSATQSISSRSLSGPVSLVATPWGHAVALVWSDGSGGTGYTVFAAANGSSSSCTGADYSAVGTTSFPVWADVRWAPQGTFECYQVATAYDSWTSIDSNPTDVVQLGVVASSVAIVKGGDSSSRVDTGDKIVVTFNQSIADSSQPAAGGSICTSTSGYIALGSSANGATCSNTHRPPRHLEQPVCRELVVERRRHRVDDHGRLAGCRTDAHGHRHGNVRSHNGKRRAPLRRRRLSRLYVEQRRGQLPARRYGLVLTARAHPARTFRLSRDRSSDRHAGLAPKRASNGSARSSAPRQLSASGMPQVVTASHAPTARQAPPAIA